MHIRLNRFKIKSRIFAGYGILIAIVMGVAGFGGHELSVIDSQVARLTAYYQQEGRELTATRGIETLMRATVRYRYDGSDAAVKFFTDTLPGVDQVVKDAIVAAGALSKERQTMLQNAQATLATVAANFDAQVEQGKKSAADKGVLQQSSADMMAALANINALTKTSNDPAAREAGHVLTEAIMNMRIANFFFNVEPSQAAWDNAKKARLAGEKAAADYAQNAPSGTLRAAASPMVVALHDYGQAAEDNATLMLNSADTYVREIVNPVNDVQKQLETVRTSLETDVAAAKAETDAVMASTAQAQYVLTGLALVLGLAIAYVIGRSITAPVSGTTDALKKLAAGDMTVEIPGADGRDELAEMARTVDVFKRSMIEAARLTAEQKSEAAEKERRRNNVDGYIREFETSVSGVLDMVASASTELEATAKSMSQTAEETQRQSTTVAAASEQASTNVQTVATAAEELSSSISEIGRQVSESARITSQAVHETERTNAQIHGLAEAAKRIGDVVKLINDIAGQTNLLALNATIEAARAGEAGKGFAVVASEVKSLANQTAKATEEISAKITEIQSATAQSVEAVQGIGQTISRINEIATTIASAVEEQGAATQEIARNVQQASAGTTEVSSNITGVTKAANDTGAASAQVLGAAGELSRQSETLRSQVGNFLTKIRAA